jgi:hypothetical protein
VTLLWDMTPCSVVVVYRRFGSLLDLCWFLAYLTLALEDAVIIFFRNVYEMYYVCVSPLPLEDMRSKQFIWGL